MQIAWETTDDNRTEQLSRLVILYEKEMLKLCYVYLRDMTLAQDALQESFLKAYRRMDTFRGQCSERTWLTTIVINTCKDLRRSAWFRNRRTSVSPDSLPLSVPPPDDLHLDLMNAILALPVKNREVILLKYQQGLNNQEIAKLLHLSPMAVSKRMHQAYDRLKNLMEEGNEHE
ncbi:MAG: sigma-70 family RNA polymerase sigma factor [Clostridia bacterium]|nr:sigma-70 family RNA polymerase sigma factor [Clostridia bacterium]